MVAFGLLLNRMRLLPPLLTTALMVGFFFSFYSLCSLNNSSEIMRVDRALETITFPFGGELPTYCGGLLI